MISTFSVIVVYPLMSVCCENAVACFGHANSFVWALYGVRASLVATGLVHPLLHERFGIRHHEIAPTSILLKQQFEV